MCKGILALALLLASGEGVRQWWFKVSHAEVSTARSAEVVLHFDPDLAGDDPSSELVHYSDSQQEKIVDRLLGHDRCHCGVWQDKVSPGRRVYYTWVEYDAGNTRYLKDLFGHPPEVCAGKSGATQIAIHPNRKLPIGDRELPVRHVEFVDPISGMPFQIFKFVWLPEDSPLQLDDGKSAKNLRSARLNAALHGMPRSEARMMIAIVFGAHGAERGWQQFSRTAAASLTANPISEDEKFADGRQVD